MTVQDEDLAYEGLVYTRYGGLVSFTHPPEAILADSDTFGEYVWYVQAILQGGVPASDALMPLLCSTCRKEALQACRSTGLQGYAGVNVLRLSRENAAEQHTTRYPRREAMEEVARRWAAKAQSAAPALTPQAQT